MNVPETITIKIPSADGVKAVTVRYPTDAEWAARSRQQSMIIRNLGRGKSTTETPNQVKADYDLFNKIMLNGGDLDEYEASLVISRLNRVQFHEPATRNGGNWTIPVKTAFGSRDFSLKVPSQRDIWNYQRAFMTSIDGRHGTQELRINLDAVTDLFRIVGSAEDQGIPINVKAGLISELLSLIQDIDDSDEEDDQAG